MAKKTILNPDGTYKKLIKEEVSFDIPPSGEKFSICEVCGERFEQYLVESQNRYTSFKKCLKHRQVHRKKDSTVNAGTVNEVMSVSIDYKPHPAQQLFHDSKARFRVLNCIPPGEIILGSNKPIEDIKKGDLVISNMNRLSKVYNTISRDYDGQLISIKGLGTLEYEVTDEHPILVAKIKKNDNFEAFKQGRRPKKTTWDIENESWFEAKDLTGHESTSKGSNQTKYCLKIPRIAGNRNLTEWKLRKLFCCKWNDKGSFPINVDTAWALGLFCAEGNCDATIYYSLHEDETEYQEKIVNIYQSLGYNVTIKSIENDHVCRVYICTTQLAEVFKKEFGNNAREKQIPLDILFNTNENILISFLQGYFCGDGHFSSKNGRLAAKTASKTLALQLQLAFARLGFFSHVSKGYRNKKSKIRGREVNNDNPYYETRTSDYRACLLLGYLTSKKEHREFTFMTDTAIYVPISKISSREYKGQVFNISTNDDTYTVCNTVNHNCGARFGKDRATTMEAIKYFLSCLNEDRSTDMIPSVYWWIIAPIEKIAKQNWNELKKYFPKELIVDVSNSTMSLQTLYGGMIEVRSAYDPESLVGVGLDIVTITEASRIADMEIVWANLEDRLNSPGRGLNGKGGIGIINSSPKGRNYFHKMWTWGQKNHADYDPDWESWTFTTWDNPQMNLKGEETRLNKFGVPVTYKERLRKRKGDRRYRQDNLAEFLAERENCFKNFEENCVVRIPQNLTGEEKKFYIKEWRQPVPYYSYVVGYDPAKVNDDPAVIVIEQETGNAKRLINMAGFSWTKQYDFLTALAEEYNNAVIAFGRTGHETIDEELVKRGNSTIPLNEQGQNKANYVNHLEIVVENSLFHVLYDGSDECDQLILEFNDYSAKESGNNIVFANNDAEHDDFVSCTYFAFQGAKTPESSLPFLGFLASV